MGAVSLQYLLDTNIASDYLRRMSGALEELVNQGLCQRSVAQSALARAELRFRQAGMAAADRWRPLIDHFLMQLPTLPWTSKAADRYGALKDALRRAGTPIGELDAQMAAHALAEGLTVVTNNTRHFDPVPGLVVQDWMADPSTPSPARQRRHGTPGPS